MQSLENTDEYISHLYKIRSNCGSKQSIKIPQLPSSNNKNNKYHHYSQNCLSTHWEQLAYQLFVVFIKQSDFTEAPFPVHTVIIAGEI